jgi:hypothetical protein
MNLRPSSLQACGRVRPRAGWTVVLAGVLFVLVFAAAPRFSGRIKGDCSASATDDWTIERLPADVQLVIRIRDADRQRQSPPGQALARAIAESRLFAETNAAWNNLARDLFLEPEEAFRRLAGRRIVLAIAGENAAGDRDWAILSDVDPAIERSLRGALNIAPRAAIAGQPILSLEDGRFELAICAGGNRKGKPETRTLVLAPTGRGNLLERIVMSLAGMDAGPLLRDTRAMKDSHALLDGDVFVLAVRQDRPLDYLGLSASLVANGWEARLLASPEMILGPKAHELAQAQQLAPWSAAAIGELAPQAVAVAMFEGMPGMETWGPMLPAEAAERLDGLLGQRALLGIFVAAGKPHTGKPADPPSVGLVLAFETPDTAALAAPADAVLGRFVGALQTGARATDQDRPDFQGFQPDAPRVVPLSGSAAALWRPILGATPILTWVFGPSAPQPEAKPQPGWWVIALASSEPDPVRPAPTWAATVCGQLVAPEPPADRRPRVTAGAVKVSALVGWLEAIHADPAGTFAPLRFINAVTWDAWLTPTGSIEGVVRLRTAAEP